MDPKTRLAEARKAKAALVAQANAILASKEVNAELTPEEQAQFDKIMGDVASLEARVTQLEKLAEATGDGTEPPAPAAKGARPTIPNLEARLAFRDYITKGIRNALSTTSAAAIVPTEFEQKLKEAMTHENWLRPLADVRTITTNRDVPVVTAATTAAYTAEGDPLPTVDPSFTKAQLKPKKNVGMTKYSWELELLEGLEDFENQLAKSVGRSMAETEIKEMITGAGTAGPQGVLTGSQKGADAAATSISGDNLIDLIYSLKPGYRRNAVVVCNGKTLATIRKLKDSQGQYLWRPSIAEGQPETIIGRPVYEDPNMPDVGTGAKSVLVFDPSYYVIGDRTGTTIQVLNELYAGTGEKGMITCAFNDGRLALAETAKHLKHA